ncbi:trehalose-phosphatase [Roseomonas sp. CAU 1739]|uniref:trehalose-phosphatase n=1 Tax=Roseomonas sp. CAU 1739 TaxID=3140364 RepID=UPI00325BCF35
MTDFGVPEIEANWALFLDLDGTLLDLAPAPDAVVVPSGLIDALDGLAQRLDGALAIVTGRARATVDRLMAPLILPGGFGHGAELRDASGRVFALGAIPPLPPDWAPRLAHAAAGWPGVLLERKPHGLALHFRAAPQWRDAVRALLVALLAGHAEQFELLPAHMAFEIRPRGATKGRVVETLMASSPFADRRPVFVGDDVTDEDGMQAARRLGGLGLHVGRDLTGGPAQVRAWVATMAARLSQGMRHARA